ncbi:MAG: DUF3445 domain-containing protein [Pseudomonadota bacterium]
MSEAATEDPRLATALIDPAPYLPFLEPRIAHPPGLMPLAPEDWIILHDDLAVQLAIRDALIAETPDTVLALSEAGRAAAMELWPLFLAHLATRHGYDVTDPAVTRPDGVTVPLDPDRPMETLGRLVADDLCLLVPDNGAYRLEGAALCFPSRWSLAEKMGKALVAIHDPVPDYDEVLARRVQRVFDALKPGRPLWRINWLMHTDPALHQPPAQGHRVTGDFFLRTERQTLTRLPQTGAVVFGIKTSITPIDALPPDVAAGLARETAALDPAAIEYRIGTDNHRRAQDRLAVLAQGGEIA